MRLLIGSGVMLLGFIFGVMYDQNMAILPLRQELLMERERNDILKRALDLLTPNKFKQRDAIWTAVQEANRGQ